MFPHSTAMTPKTQETIGSNVANRPVWVGPVEPSPLLALSKASSPNELAKTHHATIASCSVHETAPKARKPCGMRSILLKRYNVCILCMYIYIHICIMHILGKLMFSTKVAWEARTVCRKEGTALSNKSKTKVSCNTLRLVSTINNWPVSTRINWSLHRPLWALPMPIDYTLPKCDGSLNFWTRGALGSPQTQLRSRASEQISPTEGPLPSYLQSCNCFSITSSHCSMSLPKSPKIMSKRITKESLSFNGLLVLGVPILCIYVIYLCRLQNLRHANGFCLQNFVGLLPYIGRK